jgi:hypothetical protein
MTENLETTHSVVGQQDQLGQRFLTCACGHRTSGGIGDRIAERNMDYHVATAPNEGRALNDIMPSAPRGWGRGGAATPPPRDRAPAAPELTMPAQDDGQILASDEADYTREAWQQGWVLLDGWTGQYGYTGPVMHPSEYIGGALEEHIRRTPGTYVAIPVETAGEDEPPAGWAVAYRPDHADYPHEHGRLHSCPACEAFCYCTPGTTICVYDGPQGHFYATPPVIHEATAADAGCWVEGSWGQYGLAHLVNKAESHGYPVPEVIDLADRKMASMGRSGAEGLSLDEEEVLSDAADEVTRWLNDNVAPQGYSFDWWEGEFYLWPDWQWEDPFADGPPPKAPGPAAVAATADAGYEQVLSITEQITKITGGGERP